MAKPVERMPYFDQETGAHVTIEIIEIDPTLATKMLDANPVNRNASESYVGAYTNSMANGRWKFLGDPIRMNKDDEILDGQQRLKAIEQSGTTQRFVLIRGLPTEHQKYMDQGRPRTARDNLHMAKIEAYSDKATIATLLLRWDSGTLTKRHIRLPNDEIVDFVMANNSALVWAVNQARSMKNSTGLVKGVGGAVYFRTSQLDTFQANEFATRVATGEGLETGSPILALRSTITKAKLKVHAPGSTKRRITTNEELYYVVRAWNAYRAGEYMTKLQLPTGLALNASHFVLK